MDIEFGVTKRWYPELNLNADVAGSILDLLRSARISAIFWSLSKCPGLDSNNRLKAATIFGSDRFDLFQVTEE